MNAERDQLEFVFVSAIFLASRFSIDMVSFFGAHHNTDTITVFSDGVF